MIARTADIRLVGTVAAATISIVCFLFVRDTSMPALDVLAAMHFWEYALEVTLVSLGLSAFLARRSRLTTRWSGP
jgi:hypothetical protein